MDIIYIKPDRYFERAVVEEVLGLEVKKKNLRILLSTKFSILYNIHIWFLEINNVQRADFTVPRVFF